MYKTKGFVLTALVAVITMEHVCTADEKPQFQLTNKLGVEKTFSVNRVNHGSVDHVLSWEKGLVFSLGDGVFLGIPFDRMREVVFSNGVHLVTLTDGKTVSGKLISTVTTSDGKKYDLGLATRLILKSPGTSSARNVESRKTDAKIPVQWELQITKPFSAKYTVTDPFFIYTYYSSAGYIMGGSRWLGSTTSFYVKAGTEEMLAELSDFACVSMKDHKITVKATNGTETTGTLVLKEKDSAGIHEGGNLCLKADLPNEQFILISFFYYNGTWSLTKSVN